MFNRRQTPVVAPYSDQEMLWVHVAPGSGQEAAMGAYVGHLPSDHSSSATVIMTATLRLPGHMLGVIPNLLLPRTTDYAKAAGPRWLH